MVVTSCIGLSCLGVASLGYLKNYMSSPSKMKRLIEEVLEMAKVEVRHNNGYEDTEVIKPKIQKVRKRPYGFDVWLELPKGYAVDKFRNAIPVVEQGTVSKIRAKHVKGRQMLLELGMMSLRERMEFNESLIISGQPSIPYYTPFGIRRINFWDESCCHIIVAGATRMGKSVFLRLLFTTLTLAMDGKIKFFYVNNKVEDYAPMRGIPQIPEPAETIADAGEVLGYVFAEMKARKEKLRKTKDSVNIRQYREKHPDDDMPPVFVVFDEYGRFAEDEDFQKYVQEIAETAGYLDIHLVIATQRPDATTVLKPRIRANILTRICFQTADEQNSMIVIHTPDAAHLDEIRGRAIVLDGMPILGQIPYVSEDMTAELLLPYRREDDDADTERCPDSNVSDSLPSFITGPIGSLDLLGNSPTVDDYKSNYASAIAGRSRSRNSKTKGRVLSIHAESDHHSP